MLKKYVLLASISLLTVAQPASAYVPEDTTKAADQAAGEAAREAAGEAAAAAGEAAAEAALNAETASSSAYNPFTGFDKFGLKRPIIDLPEPDAKRMVAAEAMMTKLMPTGTYRRTLDVANKELLQPMINRAWDMTGKELAELFNIPVPEGEKVKEMTETLGTTLVKGDPNIRMRIDAYINTYVDITGEMSSIIEPDVRKAMARDYARKYDLAQLTEMNRFFATSAGAAFAKDFMLSNFTLDVFQTTLMVMPKMMKEAPAYAKRWEAMVASLPPVPKKSWETEEFTTPECAKDGKDSDCSEEDKAILVAMKEAKEAAAEAELLASESGNEPWYTDSNWSAKQRTDVAALGTKYDSASAKSSAASEISETAYQTWENARQEAIGAARKKYKAQGWKPEPVKENTAVDAAKEPTT